jgi:hypothetical protein
MDLVRSCYASDMAPYPDRPDVTIAGQWHFCPPGARVLPFPTSFCSAEWDADGTPAIGLGEQPPRGAYTKGPLVPAFQGRHFCGRANTWLNGIPFAEASPGLPIDGQGIPLCCRPLPYSVFINAYACGCSSTQWEM